MIRRLHGSVSDKRSKPRYDKGAVTRDHWYQASDINSRNGCHTLGSFPTYIFYRISVALSMVFRTCSPG